jgi:glycine cleavage system H protein
VSKAKKQPTKRVRVVQRERAASLVLRFSEDHLWVRLDGDRAQIGLSENGQKELGPIIAAELPEVGEGVEQGEQFGELESQRTVQELLAPVSGTVTAVNTEIEGSPSLVNEDPYRDGWLIEVEMSDEGELDHLMSAEEYDEFVEQEDAGT